MWNVPTDQECGSLQSYHDFYILRWVQLDFFSNVSHEWIYLQRKPHNTLLAVSPHMLLKWFYKKEICWIFSVFFLFNLFVHEKLNRPIWVYRWTAEFPFNQHWKAQVKNTFLFVKYNQDWNSKEAFDGFSKICKRKHKEKESDRSMASLNQSTSQIMIKIMIVTELTNI